MRKRPDEESGIDWKVLLEDVSFSGIERDLIRRRNQILSRECTLKTAQPDGKTSCKETSCECV